MNSTHTCGELRIENIGQTVTLVGWVHRSITLNGKTFVDLRDSHGITLIVADTLAATELVETENSFGRDWAQITGVVVERHCKDSKLKTGDIEIHVSDIKILNKASIINIRRIIWTYEYFGFALAAKFVLYDLGAMLLFIGYCLTLPFRFIAILCRGKR